jgi:inner membrane protein
MAEEVVVKKSFFERHNTTFKGIIVAFLLLCMVIPREKIESLMYEREYFRNQAIEEVSTKWSYQQNVMGPVISVPYIEFYREDNNKPLQKVYKFAHFLPQDLKINAEMIPTRRHRGIYEVVVYVAKLHFDGYFQPFDVAGLGIPKDNILWDYAFMTVGMNDLRGIEEQITLQWNDKKITFNPGMETNDVMSNGISTKVPIRAFSDNTINRYTFNFDMVLRGTGSLNFTPVGHEMNLNVKSAWTTPKFEGAFLPDSYKITSDGFVADWKVLHLNRPFPQAWLGNMHTESSAFGVNLLIAMDDYKQSSRSVKYAFILITLTFALYFFIEMLNKRRIHPFHYILVGLAICLFFTLLISMTEHIRFSFAYGIATVMTVGLVFWYSHSILKDKRLAQLVGGVLGLLYAFIFLIVQLEDYALLVGSLGLFAALAIVMHYARKVDWYDLN